MKGRIIVAFLLLWMVGICCGGVRMVEGSAREERRSKKKEHFSGNHWRNGGGCGEVGCDMHTHAIPISDGCAICWMGTNEWRRMERKWRRMHEWICVPAWILANSCVLQNWKRVKQTNEWNRSMASSIHYFQYNYFPMGIFAVACHSQSPMSKKNRLQGKEGEGKTKKTQIRASKWCGVGRKSQRIDGGN